MKSVLITGCNRGIGLELVKQLTEYKTPPDIIIATCRKPDEAQELKELSKKHKSIHILKLDTTDFSSYGSLVKEVDRIVGEQGLNVLINNAAITGNVKTRFFELIPEDLELIYKTNTVAPIILSQALMPLLKRAALYNAHEPMGVRKSCIINMSTPLACVSFNTFQGYHGYKESKAALNMATRSMSLELYEDEILVVALNPGWLKTDMGGKEADFTVEYGVSYVINVLFSLSENHNGLFIQYDGKVLAW